jgi:hypothetical protein
MYWMQARDIPAYDAPFQKVGGASLGNIDMSESIA